MTFLKDGDTVAPGITAMAAFGHTPGHMTFMLDSMDKQLLLMADLANHYVWSLAHPDWEVNMTWTRPWPPRPAVRFLACWPRTAFH